MSDVQSLAAYPDSKLFAFGLASLSGFAEPIGAFLSLVLIPVGSIGLDKILALVAGIMTGVACYELIPEAMR